MPIGRWGLAVVSIAILLLPTETQGQQAKGPMLMTAMAAPQSFWVKKTAANVPSVHGGKVRTVAAGGKKNVGNHTTEASATKKTDSEGKNESIADAMEKGRSTPWSIVLGLTLLTLLPALLLSMTPLVRLLVVFHFLRQALGTQTAPSNQVLMGLALMMTWFLMQPVMQEVEQKAVAPYRANAISGEEALDRGVQPVKKYMLRYAREKDLAVFASAGMAVRPRTKEELPIQVVVPAYILSELKAGFQIGAVLFLPFLLVDLVVASVTTSIGMMQLPPVVISTPLKILLFVMVDGWNLLADQLIKSF
ncbi:MAG TPA: flagellar type III secretion system pore protein FliP [Edaphobacter sp.]|nr:flagellar type III secretion system pore protein FliP [Edaphobacter sp.]